MRNYKARITNKVSELQIYPEYLEQPTPIMIHHFNSTWKTDFKFSFRLRTRVLQSSLKSKYKLHGSR